MPAVSEKQRRFFGMVHAMQKGELKTKGMSSELLKKLRKVARSISAKSSGDFAKKVKKGKTAGEIAKHMKGKW